MRVAPVSFACLLGSPAAAFAGMPAPFVLVNDATERLQTLSFFLMLFLAAALVVRGVWNSLRSDFPRLPRLSYPKAVGLVGVWGLLFLLVLTMISGARELMTPGAWKRDGATYKLADAPPAGPTDETRRAKLLGLYAALAAYAAGHDGRFPLAADDPAIAAERWKTPHASGMRYLYLSGRSIRDAERVLAFEPDLFPDGRFVLFTNGDVKRMPSVELVTLLQAAAGPKEGS